MTDREKMQEALEAKRKLRAEFDVHLQNSREEVCQWLKNVAINCGREERMVRSGEDIADGEIGVPWDVLQDAISRFRVCRDEIKWLDSGIEDMIQTLADEEVWR